MKNLFTILSVLIFAVTQNAQAKWKLSTSVTFNETEMTEEKNCFVVSDFGKSIRPLDPAYQGLKQAIGVGIKDDGTIWGAIWAYLVFNDSPDLTGYQDRGKDRVVTHRAKFDEEILSITYLEGDPDRFMYVDEVGSPSDRSGLKFMGYLLNNKTLLTEQEQFENGKIYYKHDLSGFKEKYHEAREACGLDKIDTMLFSYQETEKIIITNRKHLDDTVSILTTIYGDEANLNHLDVSGITDFSDLFADQKRFNGDLSEWNVSAGTNFSSMFSGAAGFNGDLSKWDVSAGTNFSYMFYRAASFNQDLSEWDVFAGEGFGRMFYQATAFNQDLSYWEVAPEADTGWMFKDSGVTDFTSYPWYTP